MESEIYKKSLRDPPRSRDRSVPPPRHSPSWPIHARARLLAALSGSACTRRSLLPQAHWRAAGSSRPSTPDGFCAAGSSRSSTPDALAPQARLDPPRGWRAGSAWAPALGSHCGLRGRLRHRRAARSEPIVHCRWCHAPRLSVLLARAASSASRVPSARGAPLGLAAPPPPCTLAHASASASADRFLWATSRLQLGANLAADRTGARTGASTRAALVHSRARRAP